MVQPRTKLTLADYLATPEDQRYQLLDGELILAAAPSVMHQKIVLLLCRIIATFAEARNMGTVLISPADVVLSEYDVVQPDILFVAKERSAIITEANIQGAPDLVVEVLSPSTEEYDRGYKLTLYSRHGVREYWLVDPAAERVEVFTASSEGLRLTATYQRVQTLVSPLLPELSVDLERVFSL